MQYTIKVFGQMRLSIGAGELKLEIDEPVVCAKLRTAIAHNEPRLAAFLPACRFAVNQQYVDEDHRIECDDEIALIGLVAGG